MTVFAGKRVEIGLGAATSLSLASARELAAQLREAVSLGHDPRSVLSSGRARQEQAPTFGEFSSAYISSVETGWRNKVHRQQWRSSLRDHAAMLHDVPIRDVGTDMILSTLRPIWTSKPETARRVRGRIERILDAAKVRGLRDRDAMNPATWRGHLALLLPAQSKLARGHHPALPWHEAPDFMRQLRSRRALAARCLEFVILTAARSGEALGATWAEVDLERRVWTVPKERMKAGEEHAVPLPDAAIELLICLKPLMPKPQDRIFAVAGATKSNMAMAMLLRRMGYGHITVHGFRSTFRDWAGDGTEFPRELVEQALAHTITNKAERAYRRGTALERRRELMSSWSRYLGGSDDEEEEPAGSGLAVGESRIREC